MLILEDEFTGALPNFLSLIYSTEGLSSFFLDKEHSRTISIAAVAIVTVLILCYISNSVLEG